MQKKTRKHLTKRTTLIVDDIIGKSGIVVQNNSIKTIKH